MATLQPDQNSLSVSLDFELSLLNSFKSVEDERILLQELYDFVVLYLLKHLGRSLIIIDMKLEKEPAFFISEGHGFF